MVSHGARCWAHAFARNKKVNSCLQEIPTASHRALQLTQIVTNDKNAHGEHKPCVLARALETWRCPVSAFGEQMLARYASVTELLAAQSSAQLRKHVIFSRKDDFTKTMALDSMRESTAVAMEAAGHMCRLDKHQAVTEREPRLLARSSTASATLWQGSWPSSIPWRQTILASSFTTRAASDFGC